MWTRSQIIHLLNTNPRAVERGILRLWERQTADEMAADKTKHSNGVGFNATDAKLGSYMAKWVKSGKPLSGKYAVAAKAMCIRYSGQLTHIANSSKPKSD